jgi:hypothetical protein
VDSRAWDGGGSLTVVGMSIPAGLFANIPKLIMDNLNIGFGSCSFVLFF